eukprot:m.171701 g.171701  ORF g.171701 m.171701 type:complete len:1061 (+) comp16709_c0_seq1:89-3271(+)
MPNLDLLDHFEERVVARVTSASTPLINEYKWSFAKRRILTTITGGLRLPTNTPLFFFLLQLGLGLVPVACAGLGILLIEVARLSVLDGASIAAVATLVAMGAILWVRRHQANRFEVDDGLERILDDEAEPDLVSCADPETCLVAFDSDSWLILAWRALTAAVVSAGVASLLRPSLLSALMSPAALAAIMVFGLIATYIAQYPLLAGTCPELFPYIATPPRHHWDVITRAAHLIVLLAILAGLQSYQGAKPARTTLYVLWCVLPVAQALGWLPDTTALLAWLLETYNCAALGGSPTASTFKTGTFAVIGSAAGVVLYFILEAEPGAAPRQDLTGFVAASALVGHLLALDWTSLTSVLQQGVYKRSTRVVPLSTLSSRPATPNVGRPTLNWPILLLSFLTALIVPTMVVHYANRHGQPSPDGSTRQIALDAVTWLHWGLICLLQLLQAPLVAGLWHNPFYRKGGDSPSWLGKVHRILVLLAPLTTLFYLSYSFSCCHSTATFWLALASLRAFRVAWQTPVSALLHVAVAGALNRVTMASSQWHQVPLVVQLLAVGAVLDRWPVFVKQVKFVIITSLTAWSIRPMRMSYTPKLLVVNALLFPVVLALLAASAILGGTIVPLFGLPIFLLAGPRPKRFWASIGDSVRSPSAMYYTRAAPMIGDMMQHAFQAGRLGNCRAGDMFLFRFENRMMVVEVIELTYNAIQLLVKGLELAETSCHTTEATHLETALDWTFSAHSSAGLYPHMSDSFTPVLSETITTLTDTRNQLTGIIDNPEVLKLVEACFARALVWQLASNNPSSSDRMDWNAFATTHARDSDRGAVPLEWLRFLRKDDGQAWGAPRGGAGGYRLISVDEELSSASLALGEHSIVTLSGLCMRLAFDRMTACKLAGLFNGQLPADFSATKPPPSLAAIVIVAARYACKLALDMAIQGEVEVTSAQECLDELQDLATNWHLGPSEDNAWFECVRSGAKPSLFAMQDQGGFVSSHLVTTRPVNVRGVQLNDEAVRGQWSNLVLELLYLTNDDDERYSIQAHAPLLRNLTLQMAEPPLGYHVYANALKVSRL